MSWFKAFKRLNKYRRKKKNTSQPPHPGYKNILKSLALLTQPPTHPSHFPLSEQSTASTPLVYVWNKNQIGKRLPMKIGKENVQLNRKVFLICPTLTYEQFGVKIPGYSHFTVPPALLYRCQNKLPCTDAGNPLDMAFSPHSVHK